MHFSVENIVWGDVRAWKRPRQEPARGIASEGPEDEPNVIEAKQRTKPATSAGLFWADQGRDPGATQLHRRLGTVIPGHGHCVAGKDMEEGQADAMKNLEPPQRREDRQVGQVILLSPSRPQNLTFTSKGHAETCRETWYITTLSKFIETRSVNSVHVKQWLGNKPLNNIVTTHVITY